MVIVAAQTQDHGLHAESMIPLLRDISATVLIGSSSARVNPSNVTVQMRDVMIQGVDAKAAIEKIVALVIVEGIENKNKHISTVKSSNNCRLNLLSSSNLMAKCFNHIR